MFTWFAVLFVRSFQGRADELDLEGSGFSGYICTSVECQLPKQRAAPLPTSTAFMDDLLPDIANTERRDVLKRPF